MLNCDVCLKDIGTLKEPIFTDRLDRVVCFDCCTEEDGEAPLLGEAEFDDEEVTAEQVAEYFRKVDEGLSR